MNDPLVNRAMQYEKLGMDFADAMRLSNLQRLDALTNSNLSNCERSELNELSAILEKLRTSKGK